MDQSSQTRELPAGNLADNIGQRARPAETTSTTSTAKPAGHIDKTVQNLAQDLVASKEVTTTMAAAASDMATKTVIIHTKSDQEKVLLTDIGSSDQPISFKEIHDTIYQTYKMARKQLRRRVNLETEKNLVEIYNDVNKCIQLFDRLYVKEKEIELEKMNELIIKYNEIYYKDKGRGKLKEQGVSNISALKEVTTAPTLVDEMVHSTGDHLPDATVNALILDFFGRPPSLSGGFLDEQVRKEDKNNYFEDSGEKNLLAMVEKRIESYEKNLGRIPSDEERTKIRENIIKQIFQEAGGSSSKKNVTIEDIIRQNKQFLESIGGILSVEKRKLFNKVDDNPEMKKQVALEIASYRRNPHCADHPILAAVCANCPTLLDMFIKSLHKDKTSCAYALDRTGRHESTPLIMAIEMCVVEMGRVEMRMRGVEMVEQLLRAGAKPTTAALMAAVKSNNMPIVRKLIMFGAKPDDLILEIANRNKNQEIIDLLNKVRAPSAPVPAYTYKTMREIDIELFDAVRLWYQPEQFLEQLFDPDRDLNCEPHSKWPLKQREQFQKLKQFQKYLLRLDGNLRQQINKPSQQIRQHIRQYIYQIIKEKLEKEGSNPNVVFYNPKPEDSFVDSTDKDSFSDTTLYWAIRNWRGKEDTALISTLQDLNEFRYEAGSDYRTNDRDRMLHGLILAATPGLLKREKIEEFRRGLRELNVSIPQAIEDALAANQRDAGLLEAIANGNQNNAIDRLKAGANPINEFFPPLGEKDPYGDTALYCAIRKWKGKDDTPYINQLRGNCTLNERDEILLKLTVAATLPLPSKAEYVLARKTMVQDAKKKLDAWGVEIPPEVKKILTENGYFEES